MRALLRVAGSDDYPAGGRTAARLVEESTAPAPLPAPGPATLRRATPTGVSGLRRRRPPAATTHVLYADRPADPPSNPTPAVDPPVAGRPAPVSLRPARRRRSGWWPAVAVGAVAGGGLVFGGLSAVSLRRDLAAPPPLVHPSAPASASASIPAHDDPPDALAALAEHKRESAREVRALLAAQHLLWRAFETHSAQEVRRLVTAAHDHPLPDDGLATPFAGLTLRRTYRLPDATGTVSQWSVTTDRFGDLLLDVTEESGSPRLHWAKLAPQLSQRATPEFAPPSDSPPPPHTAATP